MSPAMPSLMQVPSCDELRGQAPLCKMGSVSGDRRVTAGLNATERSCTDPTAADCGNVRRHCRRRGALVQETSIASREDEAYTSTNSTRSTSPGNSDDESIIMNEGTPLDPVTTTHSRRLEMEVLIADLRNARIRATASLDSALERHEAALASIRTRLCGGPRGRSLSLGLQLDDAQRPLEAVASPVPASPSAAAFSVIILTLDGASRVVTGVCSNTQVCELVDCVAAQFEIPSFAVRLMLDEQVLHMSFEGTTLGMVGIADGSELLLVKNFGWGKPDIRLLAELAAQPPATATKHHAWP